MPRTTVVAGQVATATLGNNFYQLTYDLPRNQLINGGMEIWQRGTSGLPSATGAAVGYMADRWQTYRTGYATGCTGSQQTGPTGSRYALRVQRDSGNTSTVAIQTYQTLETAQTLNMAGDQITFSAWVRKGADFTGSITMRILYGTGTDQRVTTPFTGNTTLVSQTKTLTTGWVQYSVTGTLPSTATELAVGFQYVPTAATAGANDYFEFSLAQLEIGAVPTPFQSNGGSVAAELAACQRYYQRLGQVNGNALAIGAGSGTTTTNFVVPLTAALRTAPGSVAYSNVQMVDGTGATTAITALALWNSSANSVGVTATHALADTAHRPYFLSCSTSGGYIEVIAEL